MERLLRAAPRTVDDGLPLRMTGVALLLACVAVGVFLQPTTLHFVHRILEHMVD